MIILQEGNVNINKELLPILHDLLTNFSKPNELQEGKRHAEKSTKILLNSLQIQRG